MLRKYSTVERYLWRDPEFRALGHLEKLLWLHLLTSPLSTTLPGLIPTSLLILADEMGFSIFGMFHDELACEEEINDIDGLRLEDLIYCMTEVPEWSPGLLLGADGYSGPVYRKG